jgi:FMN phosphatase YigB (HAD superfamily)
MDTMLKAVLIDLDNTMILYDEPAFYERYFDVIIPRFEDIIPPNLFRDRLLRAILALPNQTGAGNNRDFFLDRFCSGFKNKRSDIWQRFMAFYETGYDTLKPPVTLPGDLVSVLDRLHGAGLRLVVASNPLFPEIALKKRMAWGNLPTGCFELMTHMENMCYVKPQAAYYRDICRKLGEPPEACLMIGNDPVNDMAAKLAGLKTYHTIETGDFTYASLSLPSGTDQGQPEIPTPDFTGSFSQVIPVADRLTGMYPPAH